MTTSLLDLPVEVLDLIVPYLDPASFLRLTATCQALHSPDFLHDPHYWSHTVRTTFRVPNQPVVQNDGRRWQQLCKRLLTQRRIYTWGNNEKACLGHSYETAMPAGIHMRARMVTRRRRHISWPCSMQGTEGLGVVADMQCGGWSTTILTAKGALYTVGVIDGLQYNQQHPPYMPTSKFQPTQLRYPPGFANPAERSEPSTAIQQFSSGRAHVLALSDSGKIWSWQNIDHAGLTVKFMHHDTMETGIASRKGAVKKVAAGWNKSACLIEGTGIVLWDPLQRSHRDTDTDDGALVLESALIPNTSFRVSMDKKSRQANTDSSTANLAETVGEVQSFVVMEDIVLFNTHLGKVFASQIFWSDDEQRATEPVELFLSNNSKDDNDADASFVTDVQGSFHNFAVFTKSGAVLTCTQDRVTTLLQPNVDSPAEMFKRIPALQNKGVISVAFGDYHFHALHSSGYITSYGREPQACGALGLGGHGDPEGRLRGIRYQGPGGDGELVPHAYTEGRRVWFEEEKKDWITFLTAGGADPEEAAARLRMALGSPNVNCQGEVSEWVEQQGRDWEAKFGVSSDEGDGLGAYFALSVAAAGWHSGALVLVNEDLAAKVREAGEVVDPKATEKAASNVDANAGPDPGFTPTSWPYSAISTAYDYGRWFLGVGPYSPNSTSSAFPRPGPNAAPPTTPSFAGANRVAVQIGGGREYGASPREGVKYVWANDHFPRLVLRNGDEMPGIVPFDEWRFERPDWDLDAALT